MNLSPKGILLDIDNTLYPYAPAHEAAQAAVVASLHSDTGLPEQVIAQALTDARSAVHHRLHNTAASHNRLLYFQGACELLGVNPLQYAYGLFQLYWDTFLQAASLFPGAEDFLQSLTGKALCFVTDLTADVQYRKAAQWNFAQYTTHIVISEEMGVEKPHQPMFVEALRKLQLSSSDVLMIGDDFNKDVVGALNAGIAACWWNPDHLPVPEDSPYATTDFLQADSFVQLQSYVS